MPMNDTTRAIATLPALAARMLAVEILLADDQQALGDDVLEVCLYLYPAGQAEGGMSGAES
jgi:hypothetical protein